MTALRWEDRNGERWIHLEGELDYLTCEELAPAFHRTTGEGPATVVVDMSAITFVASHGMGILLQAHKHLREQGRSLFVSGLSSHIRRVFETVGILGVVGDWERSAPDSETSRA